MIKSMRVGIAAIGGYDWTGGITIIELLVRSVRLLPDGEQPQLLLAATDRTIREWPLYQPFANLFDKVIFCGQDTDAAKQVVPDIVVTPINRLFNEIDFYFPVNSDVCPGVCAASWIPDFQHRFLPELFSVSELAWREEAFLRVADQASLLIFNSLEVENHFRRFYPNSLAKTRVLRYSMIPPVEWLSPAPCVVQKKYDLPDRFVLCSNQFWQHKNHIILFQAIALLKQAGLPIHLACTGPTHDYRCPDYFPQLLQLINKLNINEQIHILGLIPRLDQIQLLRRCLFAVQPSLFEGLSLIVCECRSLGKPILLSNLAVHTEHEYGILFEKDSPCDLAIKLAQLWAATEPGPDLAGEAVAIREAETATLRFGRSFCSLTLEARTLFKTPSLRSGKNPPYNSV